MPHDEPGAGLVTPIRNRYFFGRLLDVDDLRREQDYLRSKRQLANRLLHGWGVVAGLDVTVADGSGVTVTPGLALDGWGRELVVVTATTAPIPAGAGAGPLEVVLCYAEDAGDPVPVPGLDDAAVEATTIREVPRLDVRVATDAPPTTDPVPGDRIELVRWISRRPDTVELPADPSVVLARVTVTADGAIDPDAVDITVRSIVLGNAVLRQLVLAGPD